MARGDDNIGTYLSGFLGKSQGKFLTQEAAVAYLLGHMDAADNAVPKTKALLTTALDLVFTAVGPDPYLQYFANYLSGRFTGTIGTSPDIAVASSGGGIPLTGAYSTPAIADYAAYLGKKDAKGPDINSLELFTAHAVIPAGGPLSVGTGFTAAPIPGVVRLLPAASGVVVYGITGLKVDNSLATESITSCLVGNTPVKGAIFFSQILAITSDVATGGNTTVQQIMPIRAAAAVILAIRAVFG